MIFDRGVLDSRAFIPEHLWARGVAALNRELTGCTADGSKRPEGSISNEYLLKRYDADLTLTLALALALALTLTLTLALALTLTRYDGVVHLVTAADGAETHYKHGVVTDDRGQTVTPPLTLPLPLPLTLPLTLTLTLPLPLPLPLTVPLPLPYP